MTRRAILFGVDSFWSGVDVPGEALSSVIITRLPFVTPGPSSYRGPARTASRWKEAGLLNNTHFPRRFSKLRQGSWPSDPDQADTGTIVILDSRILNKPYGRAFLRALPECPIQIH